MSQKLNLWTIYENTTDFPGQFVARRFELDQPTNDHFADTDVEVVRDWVRTQSERSGQGSPYCLLRQTHDDPVILETWV